MNTTTLLVLLVLATYANLSSACPSNYGNNYFFALYQSISRKLRFKRAADEPTPAGEVPQENGLQSAREAPGKA